MLEAIGLHVGHEIDEQHVYKQHGVQVHYNGYVSGVFKNMEFAPEKVDVILHLVRSPLLVISSCRDIKGRIGFNTIKKFAPEKLNGLRRDLLYRMMLSWVVFTDMADTLASYRFRIEDIYKEFMPVCRILGITPHNIPKSVPRAQVRMKGRKIYTWDELSATDAELTQRIKQKARGYGYEIGEQE
jgi:hypothetical protein